MKHHEFIAEILHRRPRHHGRLTEESALVADGHGDLVRVTAPHIPTDYWDIPPSRRTRNHRARADKRAHARLRKARKTTRAFTPDPPEGVTPEPWETQEEGFPQVEWTTEDRCVAADTQAELEWLVHCHEAAINADNAEDGWRHWQALAA